MGISMINEMRKAILNSIKHTFPEGSWRYVIADTESLAIIDTVIPRDDIIIQNVAGVEVLENRRIPHPDTEAIYFLTPKPHILECLLSDFQRQRPHYIAGHIIWTDFPSQSIKAHLARKSTGGKNWVLSERIVPLNFISQETHLVTCSDPSSSQMLYNPKCDALAPGHVEKLAQGIAGLCVIIDEYPIIRYYNNTYSNYGAQGLCKRLAFAVQKRLDEHVQYCQVSGSIFPSHSDQPRPRSILFITDRSMDLKAPLVHEFTYQAMAHDLLPLNNGNGDVTYTLNPSVTKEKCFNDTDEIWVKLRHLHMIDCIRTVREDLDKFMSAHPEFQVKKGQTSIFDLKTMLSSLPQFSAMKYSLEHHLEMASECMKIFNQHQLTDVLDIEQTMATGFEAGGEIYNAKRILEVLVPLLDSPATAVSNVRARLIILFLLYPNCSSSEMIEGELRAYYREKDGFTPDWLAPGPIPNPTTIPIHPRIPTPKMATESSDISDPPQHPPQLPLQLPPQLPPRQPPRPPPQHLPQHTPRQPPQQPPRQLPQHPPRPPGPPGGTRTDVTPFLTWKREQQDSQRLSSTSSSPPVPMSLMSPVSDIERLMRHGQVSDLSRAAIKNIDLLGSPVWHSSKPSIKLSQPLFSNSIGPIPTPEGMELSRFRPLMKDMLEAHERRTLDLESFPFVDPAATTETEPMVAGPPISVRRSQPTKTKQPGGFVEYPQRLIVFMAGGASYSESRVCYELSNDLRKDIILATSHMLTPDSFIEQISSLREDRSLLQL